MPPMVRHDQGKGNVVDEADSGARRLAPAHGRERARLMLEPEKRPLADIAAEVMADEDGRIGISYSGFCLTGLPHKKLADDEIWERRGIRVSLLVEPGRTVKDGKRGYLGVPYGARARMILLYLQTQAVRTGSREVELSTFCTEGSTGWRQSPKPLMRDKPLSKSTVERRQLLCGVRGRNGSAWTVIVVINAISQCRWLNQSNPLCRGTRPLNARLVAGWGLTWGGETGRALREQAVRFTACHLRFSWEGESADGWTKGGFVQSGLRFHERPREDARQTSLREDRVVLDEAFYAALRLHPVPLRGNGAARASRPQRASWICTFGSPTGCTPWTSRRRSAGQRSRSNFGGGYARQRDFVRDFEEGPGASGGGLRGGPDHGRGRGRGAIPVASARGTPLAGSDWRPARVNPPPLLLSLC